MAQQRRGSQQTGRGSSRRGHKGEQQDENEEVMPSVGQPGESPRQAQEEEEMDQESPRRHGRDMEQEQEQEQQQEQDDDNPDQQR